MQQKLLKLAKMLKRFSITEVQTMLEISEFETKRLLKSLEQDRLIKKISKTEYAYLNIHTKYDKKYNFGKQKQEYDVPFPKDPRKLFTKKEEQAIYDNAPGYAKPYLVKYYTVLSLAKSLQGNQLKIFLNNFSQEFPKYAMAPSTFLRLKRRYLEGGLAALIPRYCNVSKNKSCVPHQMYDDFKKLFLTPSHNSVEECLKKLEKKYDPSIIPSGMSFKRLLNREYSKAAINKMRKMPLELPELVFENEVHNTINDKYKKYSTYIEGEKAFLKYLENKDNEASISMKTHVKKHLHPFFKKYKFKEITQEIILEFQNYKLSQGYSIASVTRFIGAFSTIYNRHSNYKIDLQFSSKNSICPVKECKILSDEEIKEVINNNDSELWILLLGISPAELAALDYADINIKTKSVIINKTLVDGLVQTPRRKYKIRTLPLPSVIINGIKPNEQGRIFNNVPNGRYEELLNTHVKLLLNKNVPINIIYKNLGMQSINDFEQRFNAILPQKLDENFDILN